MGADFWLIEDSFFESQTSNNKRITEVKILRFENKSRSHVIVYMYMYMSGIGILSVNLMLHFVVDNNN